MIEWSNQRPQDVVSIKSLGLSFRLNGEDSEVPEPESEILKVLKPEAANSKAGSLGGLRTSSPRI